MGDLGRLHGEGWLGTNGKRCARGGVGLLRGRFGSWGFGRVGRGIRGREWWSQEGVAGNGEEGSESSGTCVVCLSAVLQASRFDFISAFLMGQRRSRV